MNARDRNPDFREADRKYEELSRKLEAGDISREEFDAERKRLMVLDGEGRWWAKSAKTGEWKFHDGKSWTPGNPPGYTAEAPPEAGETPETKEPSTVDGPAREVGEDDEARSRPSFRRPLAVAALLLVVLLVGGGYALIRGTTLTSGASGGTVAVPDLVGVSSLEEAKEAAGEDFEVVEAERVESEEPLGSIVSQEPAPGDPIAEGAAISVSVSEGMGVPDVEGEDRDEAERTLDEAGFEVEVRTGESSEGDEGVVIGQSPRAGKKAEAGSTVVITVGKGPASVETPNLIYESEAASQLEEANLELGEVTYTESEEEVGNIISQNPSAGTEVEEGAAVDIVVSTGPEIEAPAEPAPEPVEPQTVEPQSVQPAPAQPESAAPEPVQPTPAQPESAAPEPVQPTPTQPEPAAPEPEER